MHILCIIMSNWRLVASTCHCFSMRLTCVLTFSTTQHLVWKHHDNRALELGSLQLVLFDHGGIHLFILVPIHSRLLLRFDWFVAHCWFSRVTLPFHQLLELCRWNLRAVWAVAENQMPTLRWKKERGQRPIYYWSEVSTDWAWNNKMTD